MHRDVNATNIFVTYDGEIKVIDFGLAKAANRASKTAAGVIKGKVAYMSPEQAVGAPVDRRTDVFALGTTLWELGCDRRLFKRPDDVETLRRVHAADVPDPTRLVDGFPPALWRILAARARSRQGRALRDRGRVGASISTLWPEWAERARRPSRTSCASSLPRTASGKSPGSPRRAPPSRRQTVREPLKSPSTFWVNDEAVVAVRAPASDPPPAFASAPPATRRDVRRARLTFAAIAVVFVFAMAIAFVAAQMR